MSCPERFGRPRSGYSGNKALQMHFFSVECRDRPWITQFLPETANPAWGDSVPEDIECDLEAIKAPTWHIHAAKEKKGATNLASSDNINPCLEAGDLKLRSFQASSLQNTRFKTVPNQAGRCEEDAESKECHCKTLLLSLLETYAPDKIFIFQRCLMQNERFPFTLQKNVVNHQWALSPWVPWAKTAGKKTSAKMLVLKQLLL